MYVTFYSLVSELRKVDVNEIKNAPKGPITERLLSEGRITPKMLEELRKEWLIRQEELSTVITTDNSSKIKKVLSKKKRKPRL